jgi:hypothetical protein
LLRHHERHYLAVKNAIVEANDGIHSDRDQLPRSRLENCRTEWTTRCSLDVCSRHTYGDPHAVLVPLVRAAEVNDFVDPRRILYIDYRVIHAGKITTQS